VVGEVVVHLAALWAPGVVSGDGPVAASAARRRSWFGESR
jgi:hypothetical protein